MQDGHLRHLSAGSTHNVVDVVVDLLQVAKAAAAQTHTHTQQLCQHGFWFTHCQATIDTALDTKHLNHAALSCNL